MIDSSYASCRPSRYHANCAILPVASDDSSYMTGTDFKVDGGLTSCYVTPTGEPLLSPPASLV